MKFDMKFDMILNGVETDRNRNMGITSTFKNYVSITYDKALIALTRDGILDPIRRKDTLNFACRSACFSTFVKITNV